MNLEAQARRLVTNRCLIAADVDQTLLMQSNDRKEERLGFFRRTGPQIVESARLGAHIGFITGNSMNELCSRFLNALVDELCHLGELELITRFHFFCNSGGIYFRFPESLINRVVSHLNGLEEGRLRKHFWQAATDSDGSNIQVRPDFVDGRYAEGCLIPSEDIAMIEEVLGEASAYYVKQLNDRMPVYQSQYDLSWILDDTGHIRCPETQLRTATFRFGSLVKSATVQITLKPILSFRQARPELAKELVGNDLRSELVTFIQERLDHAGLGLYFARPGGRASIDVTLEHLDKAYALEFLIDHLRLRGNAHLGQQLGSNAIYFGDEVIVGGGNDYAVTRIPGLLVFAVNRDRNLIPFLRDIFVPSAIFEGPDATAEVLAHFNQCARRLVKEFRPAAPLRSAIEAMKEEIFVSRILEKIGRLRNQVTHVEDWQALHTFITLLAREDNNAKRWLTLSVNQLDAIMRQLASHPDSILPSASGSSHPEG